MGERPANCQSATEPCVNGASARRGLASSARSARADGRRTCARDQRWLKGRCRSREIVGKCEGRESDAGRSPKSPRWGGRSLAARKRREPSSYSGKPPRWARKCRAMFRDGISTRAARRVRNCNTRWSWPLPIGSVNPVPGTGCGGESVPPRWTLINSPKVAGK